MGHSEDKINLYLSNLVVKKKSDDTSYSKKTVFCDGGKSLLICQGKSCHLYNTSTGNHVKELFKCSENIISHHLHPLDQNSVIAVTENGEVKIYNFKLDKVEHSTRLIISQSVLNSIKISKFDLENEQESNKEFDWEQVDVNSLKNRRFLYAETKAFQGNSSNIYVWASWCLRDEIKAHISVFSLEDGKHQAPFALRKCKLKICYGNFALSKSQDLDMFVGLSDHCLHVIQFDNKNSFHSSVRKHLTGLNNTLTCVAIHPTNYCVATGDSIGRIIIWENIFHMHPLKEIFHWHSVAVDDILYSKYGNYIFSGGGENVLVKWCMVTRKKQFLPRLSGAICYISEAPDSSLLSLVSSDNKILIMDFNFQCVSTIQNFSKNCHSREIKDSNVFAIDSRSNSLVLRGKIGHIQFVSLKEEEKLMYTFDVTSRNFINSHSTCTITNTEVTHAAFTTTGEWLITAESRKENACMESRLKFWKFISEKGSYVLNTNVEFPHGDEEIYCLEISSDGMVVTTGPDKRFRLWSVGDHQVGSTTKEIWSAYNSRKYRHLLCYAADFSKDSSLVAVTFDSILTIWDTNSCLLKCSLSSPNNKEPLNVCKFGNNELTHLVVTGTKNVVCCWNTITLALIWTVPIRLSVLVSDPFSIYMVSFTEERTLVVFNPASPTPNLVLKNVCDSRVVAAECALTRPGKLSVYFLTENQDLFCLCGEDKMADEVMSDIGESDISLTTPYSAQIAQIHNRPDVSNRKSVSVLKNNQLFVSELLNSPAHTLSNPSFVCSNVLKGLLLFSGKKQQQPTKTKWNKADEEKNLRTATSEIEKIEPEMKETTLVSVVQRIFI